MHLKNVDQITMLRELAKSPVKNMPKGMYGPNMEELVTARYVIETVGTNNKVSYEITDEGREALKRSIGV